LLSFLAWFWTHDNYDMVPTNGNISGKRNLVDPMNGNISGKRNLVDPMNGYRSG
jgi:hypothetical protein